MDHSTQVGIKNVSLNDPIITDKYIGGTGESQ